MGLEQGDEIYFVNRLEPGIISEKFFTKFGETMQKLLSGRWLARHLLVLMVAIVLINFGVWQLRRLEEKRTRNANILATLQQPAISLTGQPVEPDQLHFHRVEVTGVFDNAQSMILRNQSYNNISGVHLLTPLKIEGSDKGILIDRGWLPTAQGSPENRQTYDFVEPVTIEGIAYRSQTRPSSLAPLDRVPEGETRLEAWFRVDIELIQQQLPYPLLPLFIRQSPHSETGSNKLPYPEGNVKLDEGPHLGYALQWFSFAVVLVIIYGLFVYKELQQET
jgi:surfeit locus 1 family protein